VQRRRSYWGWGYEDERLSPDELRATAQFLAGHLGFGSPEPEWPAPLSELSLPQPRLRPPPGRLAEICAADSYERALHSYGRSYADVVRGFRGRFDHPPDVVAHPRDEGELQAILDWALSAGAAVIPYGGGTSVVGGVEAAGCDAYNGIVTIDCRGLDAVLEVDPVSLSARIQAGATGPRLEEQLGAHGLTLRVYPQSFELSTLGGWIATRAGGHFATLYTHIDDLVEAVRAVTPIGVWESRRLPGSGAGVSPDRMLLGSEGTLGVITEAWVRVRRRPAHRASTPVRFPDFAAGAEAVRALSQSGLHPSGCRLIDAQEAKLTGAGDGSYALLVLGFESADLEVDRSMSVALELCAYHGGTWERRGNGGAGRGGGGERGGGSGRSGGGTRGDGGERRGGGGGGEGDTVSTWREAFLRAPYLRDVFVAMGVLSETFETAITWERFPEFHRTVLARTEEAVREACGDGSVTCRLTHVYPDGPAPYYTVLAPARRGGELQQWGAVKHAASQAIIDGGGTITHHHAVGREHRPWYDRQRPEPFAAALRAAKAALDPTGALNPGVLIDP
jgi:alkyldihydroxyacetonephosphate synthase